MHLKGDLTYKVVMSSSSCVHFHGDTLSLSLLLARETAAAAVAAIAQKVLEEAGSNLI
jgi:hypothetical protein